MLVAMAAPRLRTVGYEVPSSGVERPSHRLYELLSENGQDAHSRYNALVGRMVSFARAAEHASPRSRGGIRAAARVSGGLFAGRCECIDRWFDRRD